MNSPDYMVAETHIQSFWTSLKVFEPYSTSLLTSLLMIPVMHIIDFWVINMHSNLDQDLEN